MDDVPEAQVAAEAEYAEAFRRRAEPVVADMRRATIAVVSARTACPHCGKPLMAGGQDGGATAPEETA